MLNRVITKKKPAARNTDKCYLLFRIKYRFTAGGAYWTRRLFRRNIAEL
jgi:hypothetical protein